MPDQVYVHPSSFVDDGAQIGRGTKVWHFSHVMGTARIGDHCVLGQNVFIASGVSIGNGVRLQNNVSVYEGVTLEDEVFCGPSVVFTNVSTPRSFVSRRSEYMPTRVKRGATLGANSTIICGNTIGEYAMVGAGAVVTKDVPDYALVIGVPARRVGWVCRCGERIRVEAQIASCRRCDAAYRETDGSLRPRQA